MPILDDDIVKEIAVKTGLQRRSHRKISPQNLLGVLCLESIKEAPSYNDLAIKLKSTVGESASKQAFWKRVNSEACIAFVKSVLGKVVEDRASLDLLKIPYKRIIIQDSTIIKLPQRLFESFSGVANHHTQVCNARIQAVYDLLAGEFLSFSLLRYPKKKLTSQNCLKFMGCDGE